MNSAPARGQFEFDATDEIKLRVGADWRRYDFDSPEYRRASETQVPALAAGQLAGLSDLYSISSRTPTNGTVREFVVPDLDAFDDTFDIYCNCGIYTLTGTTNNSAQGNWRKVREKDVGGFLQGLGTSSSATSSCAATPASATSAPSKARRALPRGAQAILVTSIAQL